MRHYLLVRNIFGWVTLKELLNDDGLVVTPHKAIQPIQIIKLQGKGEKENIVVAY